MKLDIPTLNLLAGTVIPLLVGLVSKEVAHRGLKAVLNAALSSVAGALLVIMANGGEVPGLNEVLTGSLATFITSLAAYYGVWKPTGVSGAVQNKTADFGLGKAPAIPDDCCQFPLNCDNEECALRNEFAEGDCDGECCGDIE